MANLIVGVEGRPVLPFSPGADQIEARERLEAIVDGALAKLAAGVLPDGIEREQVDFKEEAGRRGPGGTLNVGDPHNQEAARHLANEVACMANTPGGGAIVVGVEDRGGRLLGAALDADWLRHRVYEQVGVAPTAVPGPGGVSASPAAAVHSRSPVRSSPRLHSRMERVRFGFFPELRTPQLPAAHVRTGTGPEH